MTHEEWVKAHAIEQHAKEPVELALAVLLLTSANKAERERGKEMARGWKKAAMRGAHYNPASFGEKPL